MIICCLKGEKKIRESDISLKKDTKTNKKKEDHFDLILFFFVCF